MKEIAINALRKDKNAVLRSSNIVGVFFWYIYLEVGAVTDNSKRVNHYNALEIGRILVDDDGVLWVWIEINVLSQMIIVFENTSVSKFLKEVRLQTRHHLSCFQWYNEVNKWINKFILNTETNWKIY